MPNYVNLVVRACKGGMGTFAQQWIPSNTRILEFTGNKVVRALIYQALDKGGTDCFLQVDENIFIGASGNMDDYVNHSCDPNCGLEFDGERVYLRSILHINRGDELTFDYATSQHSFPFRFNCQCGSQHCRGEIGDYSELSSTRKAYYIAKGVIAPFLNQRVEVVRTRIREKRVAH
jgi:SET domain-containing protein